MRARKEDFFQVPPYLQLLRPNETLSVTAALKKTGFPQEVGGPVSALIFSVTGLFCLLRVGVILV